MPLALLLRRSLLPLPLLLLVSMMQAAPCATLSIAPVPKPSAPPAHGKPSERTYIAQVPFNYDPILMPYVVVQVSVNGQTPLPFVVDTGSVGTLLYIEPWAARKLNLPLLATNRDQLLPGQGQKTLTYTLLNTLKIVGSDKDNGLNLTIGPPTEEEAKWGDHQFQIVSIFDFISDSYQGPQPAGIVSCHLLSAPGMACQLDFQRKLLLFISTAEGWKPAAGSVVIPMHYDVLPHLYSLSITLGTGYAREFALDTGSPTTRVHDMAALPLPNAQSVKDVSIYADRQRTYDTVLLPQLHLGDLVEPDLTLQETPEATLTGSANTLGLDFLSRFLVTLDLAKNKMYLERRSDYARQIVPQGRAGVRLEKRAGQYVAAWVEPGSPAEQAGVRIGDQIKRVDGQTLEALPLFTAQTLLDRFQGTSAKLEVQTAAGKEIALSFVRSKRFFGRRHALLGVSLDWFRGELVVSGMTAGSPLEHALKWSDEFYFINDQPVAKMTMDDAFQQLERPDLALQVWRASDKTWQELHLAPLPAQTQVLAGPLPAVSHYSFDRRTGWTATPL